MSMQGKALKKRGVQLIGLFCLTVVLVTAAAALKYRDGGINYYNSDATWHTLLTIKAYRETPVSEHLFLPIVTLGSQDDKWIPWGATVPDENGNYFYTSFSAAGYFLPWLFMKIFGLSVSEQSLYLFNTVMFAVSAFLWARFISMIYDGHKNAVLLSVIALFSYVLSPELLHGMGIVYWHQSVMQVTLLIQMMAWYQYKKGSRAAQILFYAMALANPYIEWTGYVANVGFAVAELLSGGKKQWKKSLGKAAVLGVLTIASLGLFAGHYLLRVDSATFGEALRARFMARNVTADTTFAEVFSGYIQSFGYLWILALLLAVWNIAVNQKIELRHGLLMLVMTFPLLENVLMKQHAVEYTYDRMKGIFILSFLLCELAQGILETAEKRRKAAAGLIVLTAAAGLFNFWSYRSDRHYIWEADYRADNEKLASYINQEYPDCVLALEGDAVRGYMNLLFGRGIYEFTPADSAKEIALEKGRRYAVVLSIEDSEAWNVYDLEGAAVYDLDTGEVELISVQEGNIVLSK